MRILIIRFSSLGDCVLLCPLPSRLKAAGAEEVTVVTRAGFAELFAATAGVDRVVALDKSSGLGGLLRIGREYRGRGYTVIDAHNNTRSRILSAQLGGVAARFQKYYGKRLSSIIFKRSVTLPTILEQYARLGNAVAPVGALSPGGLVVPESTGERIAQRLGGASGVMIAMAPGSRWPMKRWPEASFLELARHICSAHDAHIVLLGDNLDRPVSAAIANELGPRCTDLTGETSLLESAAAIKRCRTFVGNDSGLMHMSEAVGVPVVAVFGPTVESFGYYPSLALSRTVERNITCRPCSRNGAVPCPRETQECMTQIDATSVSMAFDDLIAGRNKPRYVMDA